MRHVSKLAVGGAGVGGWGAWTNYAVCGTCKPGELNRGSLSSWDVITIGAKLRRFWASFQQENLMVRLVLLLGHRTSERTHVWVTQQEEALRGLIMAAAVSTAKHGSRRRKRW